MIERNRLNKCIRRRNQFTFSLFHAQPNYHIYASVISSGEKINDPVFGISNAEYVCLKNESQEIEKSSQDFQVEFE